MLWQKIPIIRKRINMYPNYYEEVDEIICEDTYDNSFEAFPKVSEEDNTLIKHIKKYLIQAREYKVAETKIKEEMCMLLENYAKKQEVFKVIDCYLHYFTLESDLSIEVLAFRLFSITKDKKLLGLYRKDKISIVR